VNRPYIVTSPKQFEAIASPGRDDILDAVNAIGPCTVAQIARFLGRSRESTYYHVRTLRDCGLLLENHGRTESKKPVASYDLPGRPIVVYFNLSTPSSRRAVIGLASARLRAAKRGFERACRSNNVVVDGPRRDLWAARWKGWLSPKELEEANKLILQLYGLFKRETASRKCYEMTLAFAPVGVEE
jgi:DNA-binding transcriptional ArsR family regulator